jgi:hypothetical protein
MANVTPPIKTHNTSSNNAAMPLPIGSDERPEDPKTLSKYLHIRKAAMPHIIEINIIFNSFILLVVSFLRQDKSG